MQQLESQWYLHAASLTWNHNYVYSAAVQVQALKTDRIVVLYICVYHQCATLVLPLYIQRSSMPMLNLVMLQMYLQQTTTMNDNVVITGTTNA